MIRGFFVLAALMGLLLSCTRPAVKSVTPPSAAQEPTIRVLLTSGKTNWLQFHGTYRFAAEEADYLLNESHGKFQVTVRGEALILKSPARFFRLGQPNSLHFTPLSSDAFFVWNGHRYQGQLTLRLDGGMLEAINRVPVETYLLGVVPNEIPTGNPEYQEAVRAQAVAARTYALNRLMHPADPYFDVYGDTRDQVYLGSGDRVPELARKAVDDTRGEVLVHRGRPAVIQYHSTCGGILEPNREAAADGAAVPDSSQGSIHCSASPFYRWVEQRTVSQLLRRLAAMNGSAGRSLPLWQKHGVSVAIQVQQRSPAGRVSLLEVQVDSTRFVYRGFAIRQLLADSLGRPLPSRLFFLLKSRKNPERFYIIGAGWGHGRGMCQWGALGMALTGSKYRDILHFYYQNLAMKKLY